MHLLHDASTLISLAAALQHMQTPKYERMLRAALVNESMAFQGNLSTSNLSA